MTDDSWREAAQANLLAASKRHGRIGSRKTRHGCLTCKRRHVKCDETWPRCKKCSSLGRFCEYANDPINFATGSKSHRESTSSSPSLRTIIRSPSQIPELDDMRTFDYFQSWAAPRLAGALDQNFWCGTVLILSQTEPAVMHGLLALGVLCQHPQYMKSFLTSAGGDYSRPQDHRNSSTHVGGGIDSNHATALKYYNRSMQGLRAQSTSGVPSPTLALLSCVLYIAIELARDDVFSALALLNQGAKLMDQMRSCPKGVDEDLFLAIRSMLLRLSILAAVVGYRGPLMVLRGSIEVKQSTTFANMNDARAALTSIMGGIFASMPGREEHATACGSETTSLDPPHTSPDVERLHYGCDSRVSSPAHVKIPTEACQPVDPPYHNPETLKLQAQLKNRLRDWHKTLQIFQTSHNTHHKSASALFMLCYVSFIIVSTWLSPNQTAFDHYALEFREILRQAEIYQADHSQTCRAPAFAFEVGAIAPLFYVASKCRIPSLRRKAVDLLMRCEMKESTFSARSAAELAGRLLTIEEEGMGLPVLDLGHHGKTWVDDAVLPVEQSRVREFEIIVDRVRMRHEVRVWRGDGSAGQEKHGVVYPI